MHVNHPIWLRAVSTPGATVFAILFTLESLGRAMLATVIPLQAYDILQNERDVSTLYLAVGMLHWYEAAAGGQERRAPLVLIPLMMERTNAREGYLRKNGVPYSERATITEYVHRLPTHPNGDSWLNVVTIVEDPQYLTQPFYTSTNFRLEADGSRFNPTPCSTAPPLAVTRK